MKIAIIVRRLNVRGGTQRQALSLARELKRRGHEPALYTFVYDKEACYGALLDGMTVVALSGQKKRGAKDLACLIAPDTDVLNPHDQVSYRVAYYFKRNVRNIPSVWMMNDMPTRQWGAWRERMLGVARHDSLLRRIYHWLYDRIEISRFIKAQDVITVLDNEDQKNVARYFGMPARVVRSGLAIEEFAYRERLAVDTQHVRLLMTGIFFPHRRFEDAIVAIDLLRSDSYGVTMTVVGDYASDTAYYERVRAVAQERGLEPYVTFRGRVSDSELRECYRTHDIFIFPSILQSWGLAVFEAMASGLPVVVSRGAGAHEVLDESVNALIVPPKSPEAIASAVGRLIDDPLLYQALSRNGRRFVEEHITWERYTNEMLEVFNNVIHGEHDTLQSFK